MRATQLLSELGRALVFCLENRWGVELDMEFLEGKEGFLEAGPRGGFDDELPSITSVATFMKGGHGRRNLDFGVLA